MKFQPSKLEGVVLVEPKVFGDDRGFFMESWRDDLAGDAGIDVRFVQENHSRSGRGVLRGLHYQVKQAQGKFIRVVRGEVFDVAVDLRRQSKTFGQWYGTHLSEDNKHQLWVPPGFAHGFLTLSDTVDFLYKCTDYYAPEHERSILWNDPDLGIDWPLPPSVTPLLSDKDANATPFAEAEYYP
ncbi:MAG: dTDP-4-dehydrorhamnose 3,5-epimerase [Pseudomonadota bacterium]